ncbi:GSCOCG00012633001-RA-CDS, partial [Cotesia congregata]
MPLPTSSFEWVELNFDINQEINKFLNNTEGFGYILEVDLKYPEELYDLHNDLPLCPEHFLPPDSKHTKLATTLYDKKEYVIHYRNLKQCLDLGLKLTKVHRILKFKESQWLKPYIDKNTDCRKAAKNEFEQDFYKLMNNSVFGKTMENVRKYKDVRIVTRWSGRYGASDMICKPNFHSLTVFDENMVIIEMTCAEVNFNKPIYAGFCILDMSKTYIYDFHYNYVKKNFKNDDSKLMYTDTDSLIYHFTVPNIYEIIKRLMKDENNGKIMSEFVGLRAKLYAFQIYKSEEDQTQAYESDEEIKDDTVKMRAKGVKKSTLRTITFDDYKQCLFDNIKVTKDEYVMKSRNHEVNTLLQKKLALSWEDDKRQLLVDSTDTLPWGYEIPSSQKLPILKK